jgi:hypothetical protein
MKKTSLIIATLFAAAVAPCSTSAQSVRDFDDSWFWGVKAGVSTYSPTLGDTHASATYGAEWLITRTRAGLYVSYDESNLSATSAVFDATASGGFTPVHVNKMHRIGVAALAFPWHFGAIRPYAGLGFTLNVIGTATPELSADQTDADASVIQRIDDRRSQSALMLMGGAQAQFGKMAVFGQASVAPTSSDFLLNNSSLGFFEAGVRYNFAGAREGLH